MYAKIEEPTHKLVFPASPVCMFRGLFEGRLEIVRGWGIPGLFGGCLGSFGGHSEVVHGHLGVFLRSFRVSFGLLY